MVITLSHMLINKTAQKNFISATNPISLISKSATTKVLFNKNDSHTPPFFPVSKKESPSVVAWEMKALSCELFTRALRSRVCCKTYTTEYKGLLRAFQGFPDLTAGGQGFSVLMGQKMNWKIRLAFLSWNLESHKQTQESLNRAEKLKGLVFIYDGDRVYTTAPKCPAGTEESE